MRRLERAEANGEVPAQARPPCSPGIVVRLLLPCSSRRECEAVKNALSPDNREAPSWLVIREELASNGVVVEIRAPLARGMSVRATLDEILEYTYSLLKSVESLGDVD